MSRKRSDSQDQPPLESQKEHDYSHDLPRAPLAEPEVPEVLTEKTPIDLTAYDLSTRARGGLPSVASGTRLIDLNAQLLKHNLEGYVQTVHLVKDADSVVFDCPCRKGHRLHFWFAGRGPRGMNTRPWTPEGNEIGDLTLTAPSRPAGPVIHTSGGCWEGIIQNGRAQTAGNG